MTEEERIDEKGREQAHSTIEQLNQLSALERQSTERFMKMKMKPQNRTQTTSLTTNGLLRA
jgi:hypothetical protein